LRFQVVVARWVRSPCPNYNTATSDNRSDGVPDSAVAAARRRVGVKHVGATRPRAKLAAGTRSDTSTLNGWRNMSGNARARPCDGTARRAHRETGKRDGRVHNGARRPKRAGKPGTASGPASARSAKKHGRLAQFHFAQPSRAIRRSWESARLTSSKPMSSWPGMPGSPIIMVTCRLSPGCTFSRGRRSAILVHGLKSLLHSPSV